METSTLRNPTYEPPPSPRAHVPYGALASPKALALSPRIRQVVLAFEEVARTERLKKYKLIDLSAREQFRHTLYNLVHQTMAPETFTSGYKLREKPGLKKCPPYWYPYTSMAKGRWIGRELLEIVSTEFRDRSMEYYVRLSASW